MAKSTKVKSHHRNVNGKKVRVKAHKREVHKAISKIKKELKSMIKESRSKEAGEKKERGEPTMRRMKRKHRGRVALKNKKRNKAGTREVRTR